MKQDIFSSLMNAFCCRPDFKLFQLNVKVSKPFKVWDIKCSDSGLAGSPNSHSHLDLMMESDTTVKRLVTQTSVALLEDKLTEVGTHKKKHVFLWKSNQKCNSTSYQNFATLKQMSILLRCSGLPWRSPIIDTRNSLTVYTSEVL